MGCYSIILCEGSNRKIIDSDSSRLILHDYWTKKYCKHGPQNKLTKKLFPNDNGAHYLGTNKLSDQSKMLSKVAIGCTVKKFFTD